MKVIYLNKIFLILNIVFLVALLLLTNLLKMGSDVIVVPKPEQSIEIDEKRDLLVKGFQDQKLICLTFDDGPGKYTLNLLTILEQKNISATFFVLGESAEKSPSILKEIAKRNEIGMHGFKHKLFTRTKNDEIVADLEKTKEIIRNNTGITPNLVRVPYGSLSSRVSNLLKENNYISILWNIDSKDWNNRNSEKIYKNVTKNIKGNSIILLHDIYITTVNAIPTIIDTLHEEGYIFVTVSEFLEIEKFLKE